MTPTGSAGPGAAAGVGSVEKRLGGEGVCLDYGACVVRVRSAVGAFSGPFASVYRHFSLGDAFPFVDFHVDIEPGAGLRGWLRPQSRFLIDRVQPFDPFAASHALPHYEWGLNWSFAQRFNQYVLLHAGVLAWGDAAVVLPAIPGSGKSTLTAALMLSGLRLLSDEFGVLRPQEGDFLPMLKPVALKNASIEVIRDFHAGAELGPTFPGTRKGDVAHLAPDAASVAAIRRPAQPRLILFPAWREGAALTLQPQAPEQAFTRLAFNSFNYGLLGRIGFDAVADLAEACPAYQLVYGRLDDAVRCVHALLDQQVGGADG